jgi:hypothetical protein
MGTKLAMATSWLSAIGTLQHQTSVLRQNRKPIVQVSVAGKCVNRTGCSRVRPVAGSGIQSNFVFNRGQVIDACLKPSIIGSFAVSRKGFRVKRASRRADATVVCRGAYLHA